MTDSNILKNKFKALTLKDFCLIVIGLLILFNEPMAYNNNFFAYLDEFVVLIAFCTFVVDCIKGRGINDSEWTIIFLFIIFVILGIASNKMSNLDIPIKSILFDIFSFLKFFIMIICGRDLFRGANTQKIITIIANIVKINVVIALALGILSQFVDLGLTRDIRFGIKCFRYFYTTPALFSWYCLMYLLILNIDMIINKNSKSYFYIGCDLILWALTGRGRAVAFIFIYLFLLLIKKSFDKKHRKLKIKMSYVAAVCIFGAVLAWNQISFYFTTPNQPRFILLHTGIDISLRYFPFGAGFGTFGTSAAQKFYSPLYDIYNLDVIYGFTQENPLYLTDTFWPAIAAETGLIGLVVFSILILCSFSYMYKKIGKNNQSIMIIIFFILYLTLSSVATTIFTQYVTIGYMFFIYMIPTIQKNVQVKYARVRTKKRGK